MSQNPGAFGRPGHADGGCCQADCICPGRKTLVPLEGRVIGVALDCTNALGCWSQNPGAFGRPGHVGIKRNWTGGDELSQNPGAFGRPGHIILLHRHQ